MEGKCGKCPFKLKLCKNPDGDSPDFCSTKLYKDALERADEEYDRENVYTFAQEASLQERAGYEVGDFGIKPIKPRIREIVEFSRRMGYKKLGVAFCMGLHREAKAFCEILEAQGFEVVSVICKVGGTDKSRIGLTDDDKLCQYGHESMCNPIGQAMILNESGTDFNILLGLCVGHDSLFLKYSEALCTVLAVKDRLMGHNPLSAIYTNDMYYKYLKYPD